MILIQQNTAEMEQGPMKTHFHLRADQILRIDYDYEGPGDCRRKLVYSVEGLFLYYQIGNEWRIQPRFWEVGH